MALRPNNPDDEVTLKIDPQLAEDIQRLSREAGSSDRNLLAALVWMGKKAFGRNVKISGADEKETLNIRSFADLHKIEPAIQVVEPVRPAVAPATTQPSPAAPATELETEESDEDFPEDYEDYYPRGLLDAPQLAGTVTIEAKREDTRGRLAMIYTIATFLMFLLGFAVAVLDAATRNTSIIDNLTKILPLLSGIFLGSLGFVLGYYFRKVEGENQPPKSTTTPY